MFSPNAEVWGFIIFLSSIPKPGKYYHLNISQIYAFLYPHSCCFSSLFSIAGFSGQQLLFSLADKITPSQPKPGKSLAVPGFHHLLFYCQIFTHAFVFVQMAPVPLSTWPYFLSKAVALFFQVRFAVFLHASVFMLVISNTCCTVLLICSSFIISTQWNVTDWYLNSNPECFLS